MNLLRLSLLLFGTTTLGTGTMWAQNQESLNETTAAHGFVENRQGMPYDGISIPEDRADAVAGMSQKLTNWKKSDAVAVHYFHHPAAEVDTRMVLKVASGKTVTFKLRVYDPEDLSAPLQTVENIQVKGDGNEQEIALVKYVFPHRGYYRYCLECTSGCTDIIEISKFRHYSSSTEKTYKPGYLSSPSVHLSGWKSTQSGAPTGESYDWCYHEVMMPKESDISGTYVMSMGLMNGYMGIQMNGYENGKSRHDIIFSIWDKGSTDINPNLPDNLRAKLVDKNEMATNERFGNEGTGMKSFMAGHFWECGTFVQFVTNCRKEVATFVDQDGQTKTQENTLVSAWFNAQDGRGWQYISTLRMPAQHKRFDSWYSFLENYNWPTGQKQRKGYYRNGYGCDGSGKWYHFNRIKASHTDGERDANGNEIVGKRYDYGFGPSEECVGPNGEKAFFMTTGGFSAAVENPADPGNYECVVPLNAKNTAVDTIQLDVLLKRVDQAVENEKMAKQQQEFFQKNQLDKTHWQVVDFSSQETAGEGTNGRAAQIIDGNDKTYWHSAWQSGSSNFPHHLTVDMGEVKNIQAMEILMSGGSKRHIKAFNLYVSDDNTQWTKVYSTDNAKIQGESLFFFLDKPARGRFFKIEVTASYAKDEHHVRINEVRVAGSTDLDMKKEELKSWIDRTNDLIAGFSVNQSLDLTGRLSSNADQNDGGGQSDGGGVAALTDHDTKTYFHSRWEGQEVNAPHYIQVDLGKDMPLGDFKLTYATRWVSDVTKNSPAPTEFKLQSSRDGVSFTDIATFTKEADGLPAYTDAGKSWTSKLLKGNGDQYVRFEVTKSEGPGKTQFGGQSFFGLSEFGLLMMVPSADADAAQRAVVRAQRVYEEALTVQELDAALQSLQSAYAELNAMNEARVAKESLSTYYNGLQITEPIMGGDNPGFYSKETAEAYNQAYQSAKDVLNQSALANVEVYSSCLQNLQSAFENLTINLPEEGKFYVLRSANSKAYSKGALAYVNENNKMQHSKDMALTDSRAVWMFKKAGDQFNLLSLHTGEGVAQFTSNKQTALNANVQPVRMEVLNQAGQVKLVAGNTTMHAQENGSAVVNYDGGVNTASAWLIEEVQSPAEVGYTLSVTDYGYAGLYLNYDAVVPENVVAYRASRINGSSVSLSPLENNVIPANTGVIVEAGAGDYVFRYTSDPVSPVESLLKGSTYVNYLQGESNQKYYLFGVKDNQVGLYQAWLEFNAEGNKEATAGTDEGGYFKVSANKVYLPESSSMATRSLSFVFDEVTGLEELHLTPELFEVYDLQGRRIYDVQKSGLYIVNGQKKFIKK